MDVPFTIIGGGKDGPTLCVTAGVHGTEYAGIEGAIRVADRVKPEDLRGTLIIVPVVNVPAFEARTYVCPIDGVNMQGSYPGKPNGTCYEKRSARSEGKGKGLTVSASG